VTNGAQGVGRAVVQRLARAGAAVVFTGTQADEGAALVKSLDGAGATAVFVLAPPGTEADWPKVFAEAESRFAGLDILVLNGERAKPAATVDMPLEMFRDHTAAVLKGAFLGLKHGVAAMRARRAGGAVILMSSVLGKLGVADQIHDAAAQAGVRLLAKAAALELGPEKIRVNSVHAGVIEGEGLPGPWAEASGPIPLGRPGGPDEVADAVLFLASDRSIFMTGAEIVIDGGWSIQ
jgi:3alpha(or 20beta)-hydroxysteroid dehydrogenase